MSTNCPQNIERMRDNLNRIRSGEFRIVNRIASLKLKKRLLACAVAVSVVLGSFQTVHAGDSRTIKDTIERMETVELSGKSEMVREVYKRSLLSLYEKYLESLEKEIADLKLILANVSTSDSRMVGEITDNIKKLQGEYSITNEKFRTLSADLRINRSSSPAQNESRSISSGNGTENSYNGYREAGESSSLETSKNSSDVGSNSHDGRSGNGQSLAAIENQKRADARFASMSFRKMVGADSSEPAQAANFDITSPPDKYKTSLEKIEVGVKLKAKSAIDGNLKVLVRNDNKEVSSGNLPIKAGEDTGKVAVRLKSGTNEITVSTADNSAASKVTVIYEPDSNASSDQEEFVDRYSSIYTRAIVGFEQSGASAAQSKQKPFLEFFWNPPISTKEEGQFNLVYPRASLWGSVRLTSVPRQISTPLVTFAPGFLSPLNESNVNDLVQGFDFLAGAEMGFGRGWRKGDIGTICHPSGAPKTCQKISSYFIVGGGAINPLSPKDTVQVFQRPTNQSDLERIIGAGKTLPDTIKFIAFTSPDRDSFFRQYYAGVRIKTHYFKEEIKGQPELINRPGAMFDIAIGQNEAVSGGKLRGGVLRLDGFYPLPVSDRSIFYLYGTALINLRRRPTITDPIILATAPSNVTVPADNVFVVTSPTSNRDFYRIGLGVNFIELLKGGFNRKEAPSSQ